MKCKYGQIGACEQFAASLCPDSEECYGFEMFTKFDWLHSLNQEELAEEISGIICGTLRNYSIDVSDKGKQKYTQVLIDWINQPYEED